MKNTVKGTIALATVAAIAGVTATPSIVAAWSDNGGGRPSYTEAEINQLQKDGKWGNKIVFNSISDNPIGDEKNFVGARLCTQAGCGGANANTLWEPNTINVEDGQTYIVRMYVHNNNPNGWNGVAKDTKVAFNVPVNSAKEIEISGRISSSNATPTKYEDDVILKSDTPFHLDYVYGSALYENQGAAKGPLSDEVVNAKSGGVLIGYNSLNGEIPGCYSYDGFVTIQVKVVYDYDFAIEHKVRIVGDADKTWKDTVDAKVGDKVEFSIQYKNTSDKRQEAVAVKTTLPKSLRYVPGSTVLKNSNHPKGDSVLNDSIAGENSLGIGNYGPGANAYIKFTAEVVEDGLACGRNALINWAQAGVGDTTRREGASVTVTKACPNTETPTTTTTDGETPTALPTTGPEAIAGGIIAVGATATAAGYYIVSRRQLR